MENIFFGNELKFLMNFFPLHKEKKNSFSLKACFNFPIS